MPRLISGAVLLTVLIPGFGCKQGDPAEHWARMVDQMPPQDRPTDWARTKALMARRAPAVGDPAPDFALSTLDGTETIKLSEYHHDRPRVLIFGSFT
jgi:hypothetical protein